MNCPRGHEMSEYFAADDHYSAHHCDLCGYFCMEGESSDPTLVQRADELAECTGMLHECVKGEVMTALEQRVLECTRTRKGDAD